MNLEARTEDRAAYIIDATLDDDAIVDRALSILERRMRRAGEAITSPKDVFAYFRLRIGALEREVFQVALLDSQNRLIHAEELFRGTLTQTSVYPREVVKLALKHNAAAAIFAHNHPSGATEPSEADQLITSTLKSALGLIDVRVLDHIVVSATSSTSFAERGLL